MNIGRKLYVDVATGAVIVDTGEMSGDVNESTVEQDFRIYKPLHNRTQQSVYVMKLEYGEYAEEFQKASSYKVDIANKKVLFNYDPVTPKYQAPLTEQLEQMQQKQLLMQQALDELLLGGLI